MRDVMRAVADECGQGRPCVLVSVIKSEGSAPRAAGAQMAVGQAGLLAGSIGGGELEHTAVGNARAYLAERRAATEEYRLTKDDASSLGMICGGYVDLLYTYAAPSEDVLEVFSLADATLGAASPGWLILPLSGGAGFMDGEGKLFGLSLKIDPEAARVPDAEARELDGKPCFIRKLGGRIRAYVFGGGHLSRELVPLLSHLDFRCVVLDDREEFARAELFPDAEAVYTCDYSNPGDRIRVREGDFIVSLTRGHAGDYEVEKFALGTDASYIGVVGSKTKSEALRKKLEEEGFSPAQLDRVTSPIGVPISSDTPAEIAVSIAAQLIQERARMRNGRLQKHNRQQTVGAAGHAMRVLQEQMVGKAEETGLTDDDAVVACVKDVRRGTEADPNRPI